MNYSLRPEDMVAIQKLGEGAGGTVSKVKHVPTGFVMARKVCSRCHIGFPLDDWMDDQRIGNGLNGRS
jgi:hypothetical protein